MPAGDAAALAAVAELADAFAVHAADRDRERRLPGPEIDRLSDAGFFGLTVPSALGGPDVRVSTLTEAFRLLARADPNIGQIPHSHFVFLEALRLQGTQRQRAYFFAEALAGRRIANAQSERTSRTITEDTTTLTRKDDGTAVLDGRKFYATGSLFAHWLAVRATVPGSATPTPRKAVAFVRADAPGVTIIDDWDGIGQRTTGSGTVVLDGVAVAADHVVPYTEIFEQPTAYGSFAQVLHAALDAGIARAALEEAVRQAREARPWFESGADRAVDDLLLAQQAGEAEVTVRAAEALLREAAAEVDRARDEPTAASTERASVATAVAKVACARAAVDAATVLFELGGTRCAVAPPNLSRFWRDARTHTLHDPTRWKIQHIGRWLLDDVPPPRHGLL
ncbi:SfnB family sulfur acquisition oxidoreductase [Yinghuangia sp. ASG 101]|uniref:SfnB family sulfur acquisition oxidoreductase n=1 Tax=Yinghuangia sp. ASG 101 TaxID=2896848 RepID=UPI001E333C6A|nr:SfnB family sulfur acquisition oxidoreductase [Yinghuangia sp. ASG 101]UGQ11966.1 SfnB family sulfur acquisition oxidoreductase [Yinghuangia sp. ASG 101]